MDNEHAETTTIAVASAIATPMDATAVPTPPSTKQAVAVLGTDPTADAISGHYAETAAFADADVRSEAKTTPLQATLQRADGHPDKPIAVCPSTEQTGHVGSEVKTTTLETDVDTAHPHEQGDGLTRFVTEQPEPKATP